MYSLNCSGLSDYGAVMMYQTDSPNPAPAVFSFARGLGRFYYIGQGFGLAFRSGRVRSGPVWPRHPLPRA